MRDRLVFLAALLAAALLGALLFMPRFRVAFDAPDLPTSAPAPPPPPPPPPPEPPPPPPPPPPYVRVNPDGATACPADMVLVDGIYCPFVGHRCARYLDQARDACDTFAADVLCEGRLQRRRYCVDQHEYPNLVGARPVVMADWNDAQRACAAENKRLCTTEEWEFACEGPQMWPYPYGIERDARACNIDQEATAPTPDASDPWNLGEEVERLDQRIPSGERHRCVSPFGVYDMTGNVDEWVTNEQGKSHEAPFRSSLKGSAAGALTRARCRPTNAVHDPTYRSHQVGFRCCADPLDGSRSRQAAPQTSHIPKRQRMTAPR
ncbi:formylglycine-generating enzyme family protein [Chondromyces crocatus]|uniref:Sulfatase-modifying factor enzyme-like domain-containing protein n=1 Tax=Chondromyces crocatus TaxID=52 RepID=A0A0K1EJ24_CHOCO|nr:SUMF1/EgtB/PvdO family nonheme iron enzyme [Chondromyces crocatus]AKT40869.1 uncharacterized protein CMC5_050260 [Chondromyces crocatus]